MKLSQCRLCGLCKKHESGFRRTQVVLGRGNRNSKIMFIGEAPGSEEDLNGKPFWPQAPAGKMYGKILKNLDLTRGDVYTTNAVKCRPTAPGNNGPKNRAPSDVEIDTCKKWLASEIKQIKPKLIVTLGATPLKSIIGISSVTRHSGRLIECGEFRCYIFPLLHPAAIIHNPKLKGKYKANLIALRVAMREVFNV